MTIDAKDLIAFMASGMTHSTEQCEARWPEWQAMREKARKRYVRERASYRVEKGLHYIEGCSDLMVTSTAEAVHQWCYMPLMRQVLAQDEATSTP